MIWYIDGLVQEGRNSIANAPELRLSCTNPSIYCLILGLGLSIGEVKGEYTRDESWVKKVIPNWSKNKEDQKYLQVKLLSR